MSPSEGEGVVVFRHRERLNPGNDHPQFFTSYEEQSCGSKCDKGRWFPEDRAQELLEAEFRYESVSK